MRRVFSRRLIPGRLLIAIGLLSVGVPNLLAHDFWILPSAFNAPPGSVVHLRLRVGERFVGDPVVRDQGSIERFVAARDGGPPEPVAGIEGRDPAGLLRLDQAGLVVVGYRSRPSRVDLPAAQFEQYLREEGLERIIDARRRAGQEASGGREIFSRSAKTIIFSGGTGAQGRDRALGLRLELIAKGELGASRADGPFVTTLLYEGRPLADALVVAIKQADPNVQVRARSSSAGLASFDLSNGIWLVKAVHMIPAPPASGADWESLWASLTFQIVARTPTGP